MMNYKLLETIRCSAVTALEDLLESIDEPPVDWSGDPCLPLANSWTGVTCSKEKITKVISL